MNGHRLRPLLCALACASLSVACEEGGLSQPPVAPGVLIPATWYLHQADTARVPALISSRFIGVALERTFVDSASIEIRVDSTYTQRYWIRVLLNDSLDRSEVEIDEGDISVGSGDFAFTSRLRPRTFRFRVVSIASVSTTEAFAPYIGAPLNTGQYRLTRP